MKLQEKIQFHKPITTSREFFKDNVGVKCVHYGDIYKNYSGKTIPSSCIINNFANEVSSDKLLYCDSIIVPDVTETVSDWGHFTYIKYDGTPYINGTHAVALTCESEDELKYIFRYLSSNHNCKRLQTLLNGSTVFQISIKDFGRFLLENYHESQDEQSHIVDILGTLDDKIENNSKKAEEYEKMIELYFEQLLSEKTNEWNEQSLLDIAEYTNGLAMQKFRPRGIDYIPVVKIKELSQGRTDSNSEQADVAIGNKFIIDDGDIVFAWSGTLMVKIWCGGKAGLNQHLFKVTSEKHPKWFVYLWTKHHLIKFQNIAKGKAVTMGHIKRDDLAKSSAFIPPSNTFAQYDRIIAPIYERIVILQQENRKLMSLKSRYLQRFFG